MDSQKKLRHFLGVGINFYYYLTTSNWGRIDSGKMLEPMLCSSRVFSPFREESGDEELSVLPRHTKVIVTGNNRTKSVLVGLQGVVKKAVGLGGWHWLVLIHYFYFLPFPYFKLIPCHYHFILVLFYPPLLF